MAYTVSLGDDFELLAGKDNICRCQRQSFLEDRVLRTLIYKLCNGSFGCCSVHTMYI